MRLVAVRRPRLPVPQAVGRGRLRRARRHAGDVRRDPSRLLEAEGPARRHGREPRRGVDLLPQHAPPLLRPDVLRAGEEGRRRRPRAAVRAGLQRLDDRRVVRRRRQGPPHPVDDGAAVGRADCARTRCAAAPTRAASRSRSPRTRTRSGLPSVHDKNRFWDPLFTRVRGDRHGRVHAHRLVVAHAGDVARRAVHRELDADVLERDGLDARLHLLRHARALLRR